MVSNSTFKNTFLFLVCLLVSCLNVNCRATNKKPLAKSIDTTLLVGAENTALYFDKLQNKNIGILTNQTGVIRSNTSTDNYDTSIVDFLLANNIAVKKIYAPEHGFRGNADAGELIKDGKDIKTGLPIISLYGNSKKPSKEHLAGIDIMLFDLQDVGARFYTYISSLHYLMEACAENNIPLIVLDRPNPNIGIVDGPTLEMENKSFVGMHPIPAMHGMTIGEYAQMINGEKWLNKGVQCNLTIVPNTNYNRSITYSLPVPPSPNLPNQKAINLYASLCFFEGTNVSSGRGTNLQFQVYGSPFLTNMPYTFTPKPNAGAKDPMNNGKLCYGENLSQEEDVTKLEIKWLLKAYQSSKNKTNFFNNFFIKLAGTKSLKEQIIAGKTEQQIRSTWQNGLENFKQKRKPYLIY
ncbi:MULTISPECIES: exo-beta-N-acetylmuramidase NamZ family protein [unclassified Myroides]|uniref:exo-beta-N-acetylmuramidase NamZ family protein n=1 Tax=unclassified Myroides TaxID=2642485 RepID=UPI00310169E7